MNKINKEFVEDILQLGADVKPADFEKYINEALDFDLRHKLNNDQLYIDILDDNNSRFDLSKILNPHRYEANKQKKFHNGLKKAWAYYAYSRFVFKANVRSNAFGFVKKNSQDSEPISLEEKKNLFNHYQNLGNSIMNDVLFFINHNYYNQHCQPINKRNIFKTTTIK